MKILDYDKDGGYESTVWGLFVIEIKWLFSVVVLQFEPGSRDAFHSHAFDAISWVLKGRLEENHFDGELNIHTPSFRPIITRRSTFHKVVSIGRTWAISFRGPWAKTWTEYIPGDTAVRTLVHKRREIQ